MAQNYHREFLAHVETINVYGGKGTLGVIPLFVGAKLASLAAMGIITNVLTPTPEELSTAQELVLEEYLVALMLSGANYQLFELLHMTLAHHYAMGEDKYLKTTTVCMGMLEYYKPTSVQP